MFRNGHLKSGGRLRGTPNKNSFVSVRHRLEQLDCDPLEEAIRIARDPASSPELKARIWLSILDYTSPKLRAVSVSPSEPDAMPFKIEIVRVSVQREIEPATEAPEVVRLNGGVQ
jgi:hypothetical protein